MNSDKLEIFSMGHSIGPGSETMVGSSDGSSFDGFSSENLDIKLGGS